VAGGLEDSGVGFWRYADPVDVCGGFYGAVGFDGDFYVFLVEGVDERGIELEEGFAAGADYVGGGCVGACRPEGVDFLGELFGGVFSTVVSIHSPKIGIAKLTNCFVSIFFTTTPEVASCETTEDSRASSMCAFAL